MGIIFHFSPGCYGYPALRQNIDIDASRSVRKKHRAPKDASMDVGLGLMLAIALATNAALFAHYLG